MKPIHFVAFVLFIWPYAAFAQTSQPAISLTTDVEDGKKMVHAVVVLNGKPIENTTLQYFEIYRSAKTQLWMTALRRSHSRRTCPAHPTASCTLSCESRRRRNIPLFPLRRPFLQMSSLLPPPMRFRVRCGRLMRRWR